MLWTTCMLLFYQQILHYQIVCMISWNEADELSRRSQLYRYDVSSKSMIKEFVVDFSNFHCFFFIDSCWNTSCLVTDEANNVSAPAEVEEQKHDGHKSHKRKLRDSAASQSPRDVMFQLFDSLCEFLRQSLSRYMQHVYASHVIRAVLQVLSAQRFDDVIIHGRRHGTKQRHQSRSHSGLTCSLCFTYILKYICLLDSPSLMLTWGCHIIIVG